MTRVITAAARLPRDRFDGWRMVALAFLVQNFAIGLAFGSFGISVLAIEKEFSTSRAVASTGLSLVILAITAAGPILGTVYGRISIRRSMMVGVGLCSAGYFALSFADGWRLMLLAYALLVGPGVALTGALPCNVLVANWFVEKQGRALGIVNMPLFVMLVPLLGALVLDRWGLRSLYFGVGVVQLLVLPAVWALVDRPEHAGQRPLGADSPSDDGPPPAQVLTMRQIIGRADFWLLVLALGVIVGGGTTKLSHMVPILAEQGRSVAAASTLLALSGGAGMFGSLVFGWLADRFGGALVLATNAVVQCAMWFIFLMPVSMALLTLDAVVIGMCGGGVMAAQGVLFSHRFGVANFARAMGLVSFATLPFLVGFGPLAGYLRDTTGSYHLPVLLLIGVSGLIALLLVFMAAGERRRRILAATV